MKTKSIPWVIGAMIAVSGFGLMANPANADHAGDKDRGRGQERNGAGDRGRGNDNGRRDSNRWDNNRRDNDRGGFGNWSLGTRSSDRGSNFSFRIEIGSRPKPAPAFCPPPAPVYYAPPPRRVWVPARYEERQVQVCVEPARLERRYELPVIERRYDGCGRPYEVVARPGRWCEVRVPARFETRCEQVLVSGHWEEIACKE